ncbi:peptidoglycan/xylan/chitin deacetylase (PgdA/CDA1 family) [Symbiobacterium terraclitae]|uniref:Peptidoglycan/xylan/chitin deacetylase (PgdA/CDA1 family) n=1 Tax=Symbiobacterium terraclitae TaxID=557451 RepID=A0ABS4JMA8_9FIRM|nr:polysaccharide deacetylase family protein [Symbiobacterium terraclitae]MBP2016682.1 peptidoglycan/xylan/chitin deacetylase (PgdA/CDA1 family) [Symbiobacterium terraclitae]
MGSLVSRAAKVLLVIVLLAQAGTVRPVTAANGPALRTASPEAAASSRPDFPPDGRVAAVLAGELVPAVEGQPENGFTPGGAEATAGPTGQPAAAPIAAEQTATGTVAPHQPHTRSGTAGQPSADPHGPGLPGAGSPGAGQAAVAPLTPGHPDGGSMGFPVPGPVTVARPGAVYGSAARRAGSPGSGLDADSPPSAGKYPPEAAADAPPAAGPTAGLHVGASAAAEKPPAAHASMEAPAGTPTGVPNGGSATGASPMAAKMREAGPATPTSGPQLTAQPEAAGAAGTQAVAVPRTQAADALRTQSADAPRTPAADAPGQPGAEPAQAPAPAPTPQALAASLLAAPLYRVPAAGKEVVLTIDDGPSALTAEFLAVLAAEEVPAAFFWLSGSAHLPLAAEVVARGHQLGTHTITHPRLPSLEPAEVVAQIAESKAALEVAAGAPVRYFRPPYGEYDEHVLGTAAAHGLATVLWNVDSRDWALADDPAQIIENVMAQVRPGAVILIHERRQTLEILPELIRRLRAAGYTFVPLPPVPGGAVAANEAG